MSSLCPSDEALKDQLIKLFPRGASWDEYNDDGQAIRPRWVAALARICGTFQRRLCALRDEFFCATANETRDLWLAEYGLPDICDPYPDLCAKVAAFGGARCADLVDIATRAGWAISCGPYFACETVGAGNFSLGCDSLGGGSPVLSTVKIKVYLDLSSSYLGRTDNLPFIGNFSVGGALACDPDIFALRCLFEDVIHAHVRVIFEVIS
jgi:hypothetical protein